MKQFFHIYLFLRCQNFIHLQQILRGRKFNKDVIYLASSLQTKRLSPVHFK